MNKIIKFSFLTIASCLLLGAQVGVQSVIMSGPPSGSGPLNPCTVSAWPMNEGTGTAILDHGPAANNGTVSSGGGWGTQTGFPGLVLINSPAITTASHTATSALFTGNLDFTVALWTNATSQGVAQTWFDTSNGLTVPGIYIRDGGSGDNKFEVILTSGAYPTGSGFNQSAWAPDGSVQYLAVVYAASGAPAASHFTMYHNGVSTGYSTLTNNLSSTVTGTTSPAIGSGPGTVAYIQIFNCALNATQLAANYAAGPQLN